jgi:hypothetical protein
LVDWLRWAYGVSRYFVALTETLNSHWEYVYKARTCKKKAMKHFLLPDLIPQNVEIFSLPTHSHHTSAFERLVYVAPQTSRGAGMPKSFSDCPTAAHKNSGFHNQFNARQRLKMISH